MWIMVGITLTWTLASYIVLSGFIYSYYMNRILDPSKQLSSPSLQWLHASQWDSNALFSLVLLASNIIVTFVLAYFIAMCVCPELTVGLITLLELWGGFELFPRCFRHNKDKDYMTLVKLYGYFILCILCVLWTALNACLRGYLDTSYVRFIGVFFVVWSTRALLDTCRVIYGNSTRVSKTSLETHMVSSGQSLLAYAFYMPLQALGLLFLLKYHIDI